MPPRLAYCCGSVLECSPEVDGWSLGWCCWGCYGPPGRRPLGHRGCDPEGVWALTRFPFDTCWRHTWVCFTRHFLPNVHPKNGAIEHRAQTTFCKYEFPHACFSPSLLLSFLPPLPPLPLPSLSSTCVCLLLPWDQVPLHTPDRSWAGGSPVSAARALGVWVYATTPGPCQVFWCPAGHETDSYKSWVLNFCLILYS